METIPYIGTNTFKCGLFDCSRKLWREPTKGFAIAGLINFIYLTLCISHLGLVTLLCYIVLIFLLTGIALLQSKKTDTTPCDLKTEYEYVSKETVQNIVSEILKVRQQVISMVTGVISTTSTSEAIHLIIELKLLSMVINLFPDAFIFWIIINFIIFYAPIDKMYPNKIAYGITCVRQVIEGVIGVIEALIPKYVDEKEPKKD